MDKSNYFKQMDNLKICKRCIYDETIPGITFNADGICNYCEMIDSLKNEYKTGTKEGEEMFLKFVEEIKKKGRGKKYDCVVGVSGGTDSSYMIYKAVKEYGLRVLAVHYDNTYNSSIATENIRKVLGKLNVTIKRWTIFFGLFLKQVFLNWTPQRISLLRKCYTEHAQNMVLHTFLKDIHLWLKVYHRSDICTLTGNILSRFKKNSELAK